MSHPDPAALSTAIAEIYDAAVEPERWPNAIESICLFVGGDQALMYWHDTVKPEVDTLFRFNDDPHYSRLYEESYATLNPLFPAFAFQSVGAIVAANDVVPDAEMEETRFHREWLLPQRMTGSLGLVLEREATRAAFLTVQWQGRVMDAAARNRMSLLAPHLLRAVAIGRLFVRHRSREVALIETLDHVDAGVFLLAEGGRIVLANARGRRMIDSGRLVREIGGRLRATSTAADRAIVEHLRAIDGSQTDEAPDDLAIPLAEDDEGAWTATVLSLAEGARRRDGEAHGAIAALFVRSMSTPSVSALEALAKRHGLTASELRVVGATLQLSGLDAIADALGIARATVKTHLNHIYRKTGTRNQADLIRLVSGYATA